VVAGVAAATIGAAVGTYWYYAIQPSAKLGHPQIISIARGESFKTVAARLADAGVVRSRIALRLVAEATGEARRIKPGTYNFAGGETIADVMRHLVNGDLLVVTVTIPEGQTVHQIAQRLERSGLICDGEFEHSASDGRLVKALGLGNLGAEGYLYPATYQFAPQTDRDHLLGAMLQKFFSMWSAKIEQRRFETGLTQRELITLASIVEKEAKVAGERPLIASVFYNRLRLGMPLQSDPTAQYSFEGSTGNAHSAVHTRSQFNTYDFVGLPPHPIANPGWYSIRAVLYPAVSAYLYFVASNDGSHLFSRSLDEHEKAIAKLRKSQANLSNSRASMSKVIDGAGTHSK
jgi:UPF0755 protein